MKNFPVRGFLLAFACGCLCRAAFADAFVFPVDKSPDPKDTRSYILITINPGPNQSTVPVLIDSGNNDGLHINQNVATALGLDLSKGTAGKISTPGGDQNVTNGVPFPSNATLGTPLTPANQTNKSAPALPGTVTVNPNLSSPGNLGLTYLQGNFSGFGIQANAAGKSFAFFVAKGEERDGLTKAQNIINSASAPAPPIEIDPFGRPIGSHFAVITPTPPAVPPPGSAVLNQGYDLEAGLSASGGPIRDAPFVISTGMPFTLITMSLAQSLGLDLSALPAAQVDTNFGPASVLEANISLYLFPDPSFPALNLQAGVMTDPLFNQIGENYLGTDLLSQLPFWEVDLADGRFYAASSLVETPEPSSLWLAAAAIGLAFATAKKLATTI
jgi:hypothetical protein